MIKINIYAVGSIKEKFFKEAINEYSKRISKFAKINIIEVDEIKLQNKDENKVKEKEGEELLKRIKDSEYLIALDLNKKEYDSLSLASHFSSLIDSGKGEIAFVIGGSYGLSDLVKSKANLLLSFSAFTFPHQLFRIMLLEQIYRAYTIVNNITYHK